MSLSESGRELNTALVLIALCVVIVYSVSYTQTAYSDEDTNQTSQTANSNDTENPITESTETTTQDADKNLQKDDAQPVEDSSNLSGQVFNIDVLIARMKETQAIGVISKLSLKNKVDDLLEQVQAIKTSKANTNDIAEDKMELREKFEGLILKTVALLNKGEDFTLAEDLYLAREELWKSIMENKA